MISPVGKTLNLVCPFPSTIENSNSLLIPSSESLPYSAPTVWPNIVCSDILKTRFPDISTGLLSLISVIITTTNALFVLPLFVSVTLTSNE